MAKLHDLLGRALAVPGVRAVALTGREGLLIASAGRGTERLFEALGALGANALNLADALGQEIGQGLVVGTILEYEQGLVSVTPFGEYAAAVTFVESRGLAMMARLQRRADEEGLSLSWRAFNEHVLTTIHVTGLDAYIRIEA